MWQLLISSLQSSNWAVSHGGCMHFCWTLFPSTVLIAPLHGSFNLHRWFDWPHLNDIFSLCTSTPERLKMSKQSADTRVRTCWWLALQTHGREFHAPRFCWEFINLWHRVLTEKTARARGRFFYVRWYTWLLLIGLPCFCSDFTECFLLFRYFTRVMFLLIESLSFAQVYCVCFHIYPGNWDIITNLAVWIFQ